MRVHNKSWIILFIILITKTSLPCTPTKKSCFHTRGKVSKEDIQKFEQKLKKQRANHIGDKFSAISKEQHEAYERSQRNRISYNYYNSDKKPTHAFIYNADLPNTILLELLSKKELTSLAIVDSLGTTLSPRIKELHNLKNIFIDMPHLNRLPKSISKLEKLQSLHIKNSKIERLDKSIISLPKLTSLTLKGELTTTPPIPSTLNRVDLRGNRLTTLSWYLDSTTNPNRFWQNINVDGNPIDSLPEILLHYIWKKRITFNSNFDTPKAPTNFTFSPLGAVIKRYPKMILDTTKFTIQWEEQISKSSQRGEMDTLRYQYMLHSSGLPVLYSHRDTSKMYHGIYFRSAIVNKGGAVDLEMRERSTFTQYLQYRKDTLVNDTTFARDKNILHFKNSPKEYTTGHRTTMLNDSTALYAEVAINKTSGDTLTYEDGTPYLAGDRILIRKHVTTKIRIEGNRLKEDREKEEPRFSITLDEWLGLPESDKEVLLKNYRKKFPLRPRVKRYYKLQSFTGSSYIQPFAVDLAATMQFGRKRFLGIQLFTTPGVAAIKGGAGLSFLGNASWPHNGVLTRFSLVYPLNRRYHLKKELYWGPEIAWQGALVTLSIGRYYSTESENVQNSFFAGVDLGTVKDLIVEQVRIKRKNKENEKR